MKKIYLFLLLALTAAVLCSCAKEEYIDEVVGISTMESSYYVPVEDAIGELYQFLSELNDETRSESRPKIADVQVWDNFATTRSDGSAENPILYVVNFENEEGFAILSGDSRIVSVIAVTEEGSFDIDEEITHPGMRMYVSMLGDYVDTVMNDSGNSGVIPYVDKIEDIGIYTFTSNWQKSG